MTELQDKWCSHSMSPTHRNCTSTFPRPKDLFDLLEELQTSPAPSISHQSSCTSSSDCLSLSTKFSSVSRASSIDSDLRVPSADKACLWDGCMNISKVTKEELLDHLINCHVTPQIVSPRRKNFYCMWHGCRVYKTPSVSSGWLERHILTHTQAKGKPFTCIFNHCNQRFSNAELLERHVRRIHLCEKVKGVPSIDRYQGQTPNDHLSLNVISQTAELSLKRIARKKRKFRLYKFQAVDFYNDHAQNTVLERLRINNLMEEQITARPDQRFSHVHSATRNIAIRRVLNTPHYFMGQRISQSGETEFLLHWCGDLSVRNAEPSIWISESDLKIAESIGNQI